MKIYYLIIYISFLALSTIFMIMIIEKYLIISFLAISIMIVIIEKYLITMVTK